MLKGISHIISPDLLATLSEMGHGDEIVLADAHFPAVSMGRPVLRADGSSIPELLSAILPLIPLDDYSPASLLMMQAVEGDALDPEVERSYRLAMEKVGVASDVMIQRLERFDFYDQAKSAFAIVVTGETAKYGNLILKKGVVPIQ